MRTTGLVLIVSMSLALITVSSPGQTDDLLQRRIENLELNRISVLNALLAIGENAKVSLGITCADNSLRQTRISLDVNDETTGDAFNSFASTQPGLRAVVNNGVIDIEQETTPTDCEFLNTIIPEFSGPADSVEHLSAKLWMTLEVLLNPAATGFAGVLHPNPLDKKIGPYKLENRRVRDILDWIVAQHGRATWIGKPNANPIGSSMDQLWEIRFYGSARNR